MSHSSRLTWRMAAYLVLALIFCLLSACSTTQTTSTTAHPRPHLSSAALPQLIQIGSDPYTNSTSQHRTTVEPDSFSFGDTIVAAFQVGRFYDGGGSDIGWATSSDAGVNWSRGFLPGVTVFAGGKYDRVSDPAVAYDAAHHTWIISSLAISQAHGDDVIVNHSTDGGLTWGNAVLVQAGGKRGSFDKDWVTCDDTASSPFYGHCYVEWDRSDPKDIVLMSASTDGGLTWGQPQGIPHQSFAGIGGEPLVQPKGTVIVPIRGTSYSNGANAIMAFTSTNGGQSWNQAVTVAPLHSFGGNASIRDPDLPSAAIDESGTVYVAWEDCRFESHCSANDIVMSTSRNGSKWSAVQRIPLDSAGSGIDHLIPGIAVDRATTGDMAHLALAYYYFTDVHCFTYNCQFNVGFVSSLNGGTSWSARQQLAGPMLLPWLADTSGRFMAGDYISTSIVGGKAFPVFPVATAPGGGYLNEVMDTAGLPLVGGSITSH